MQADEAQTRELLQTHDDPGHMEFPAHFDHERAATRFSQLESGLRTAFGACYSSAGQDSSFHGDIEVPAAVTSGGLMLRVRISNFGDLAAASSEEALYCDDAELAELLHPADAARVYGALDYLGYIALRLDPLEEMYNGASAFLRERGAPWWDRYFDYL
ncbi:hypothetical protein [Actinoplanes missouriensis]|uniref:hypothetical protein n=1 Tax=Actinoplanes missouriensis TaxID=1866 RepID=UPI0012F8E4CB|nr:hypothetical protein [Actinoplanes missouriensis]